jgi:hypothetical protein
MNFSSFFVIFLSIKCSILQAFIVAVFSSTQSFFIKNFLKVFLFFFVSSIVSSHSSDSLMNLLSSSKMNHFFKSHLIPVEQLQAVISSFFAISTALAYQFSLWSDFIAKR